MINYNHPLIIRMRITYSSFIQASKSWQWNAILPILASFLSIACIIRTGGSQKDKVSRAIVIGVDGYDITRWSIWALVVLGLTLLIIGVSRLLGHGVKSFNKYMGQLVVIIVGHFIIGLILTEYKNYVSGHLSDKMLYQVKEMRLSQSEFGVTFRLAELWDYMQMHMQCCGVGSYRDYGNHPKLLPQSCCVLKSPFGAPEPDNFYQCRHDFTTGVRESMFLHTRGCHEAMYSWFLRYTAAVTGLLFGSISIQAIAILYLSYQGFSSGNSTNKTKEDDYEFSYAGT